MKRLQTSGAVKRIILIDNEDAWALDHKWYIDDWGYAYRQAYCDGRQVKIRLARKIMGLEVGDKREVDHKNRNPLDNRRQNLRIVTRGQNAQNRSSARGSSSRFRGVTWMKANKKWQAQVGSGGRNIYLGLFENEEDAAKAVSDFRRKHMPFSIEEELC